VTDACARLKNGGEAAARRDLRIKLVTEILTGEPIDDFYESPAIQWGKENEPFARMYYFELRDVSVRQIAFAHHPTIERAGASPDGLVGTDGLLEIKCPMSYTHLNYILAGVMPEEYKPQMLWQMVCTGRSWCDFVSFDPRMPKPLRVFIRRFQRDEVQLAAITKEVTELLNEAESMVRNLAALDSISLVS